MTVQTLAPVEFIFSLNTERVGLEGRMRSDPAFRMACDEYRRAREHWLSTLSGKPAIKDLDAAATHLMSTHTEALSAAYAVGVRELKADVARLNNLALPQKIELDVNLRGPVDVALRPSPGIELEYDLDGKVIGTKPKPKS